MYNKYLIVFAFIFFTIKNTNAQSTVNDATWQLTKIDDFNSLNTSNWCTDYCFGNNNGGLEVTDPANLLFSLNPGYLTIKAERLTTPINDNNGVPRYYRSGAISSLSHFTTKYGYYEISAKMPQGKGYWPAFWGWKAGLGGSGIPPCDGNSNYSWYNEIDYLENSGTTSQYDQMGGGYVYRSPVDCISLQGGPGFQQLPLPNGSHSTDEHKYAVLWEPSRMTWFFDDIQVFTITDATYTPHNPISTVLDFSIDGAVDANTVFPAYFQINYVKIWQLQIDCNTVETFCSTAFNPATYVYKVKKSVSIGGSGCSSPSTINTSSNVNLWATDFILIDEGTTINGDGSGSFSANITECPQ